MDISILERFDIEIKEVLKYFVFWSLYTIIITYSIRVENKFKFLNSN